jgi:hypothetical protein
MHGILVLEETQEFRFPFRTFLLEKCCKHTNSTIAIVLAKNGNEEVSSPECRGNRQIIKPSQLGKRGNALVGARCREPTSSMLLSLRTHS